ncbi:hydroxymethylpyrimidine/phosphomethylpyrimidine kinase [Mameliella alba]|nr:hydroxymethylpyrimidine/phosphomethylpyrimidine kinase [Mameliella alba]GGF85574.1 hypothetical protein GCM10011319_51760 [Mameliella alba]SDE31551.1 hydroxymethylpyrimidine/phosphomethylpyrimidine kinase [Mameliella alba]
MPHATALTPGLPEAAALLDGPVARSRGEMTEQGKALYAMGAQADLMKGGHAEGDECEYALIADGEVLTTFTAPRHRTRNTYGTGCTLSSAIAAGLALGVPLELATETAHSFVQQAIAAADGLQVGSGHGSLHHFHAVWE